MSPMLSPHGDRERDRQHLQPEQPVEPQQPREALAAREEQRGLLAADRDERDDRHVLLEREPDEALAAAEVDLVAAPSVGPVDLVVAARVDQQRGAGVERLVRRSRASAATVPYLRR